MPHAAPHPASRAAALWTSLAAGKTQAWRTRPCRCPGSTMAISSGTKQGLAAFLLKLRHAASGNRSVVLCLRGMPPQRLGPMRAAGGVVRGLEEEKAGLGV